MSSFTEAKLTPTGKFYEGREIYKVDEDFVFEIGYLGSGLKIIVGKGFLTDGPSIPSWLRHFIPAETMYKSSIIHDHLREDLRFTLLQSDAIFLTAMQAEKTPRLLRELAFLAVRFNKSRASKPPIVDDQTGVVLDTQNSAIIVKDDTSLPIEPVPSNSP